MEHYSMVKSFLVIVISFTTLAITTLLVPAATAQVIGNDWKLCDSQTHKVEREKGIPLYLLKSISLAETGRWDKQKRANVAWPWTVTALGVGNYFQNKVKALKYVRFLQANAITNIDVGCMQVNLYYHGDAFASLEDALDPATNVTYAAKYLKGLYQSVHSWTKAAGFYHSKTPKHFQRYKFKVLKYWKQQHKLAGLEDRKAVNLKHMTKLNAQHKQQKQKALSSTSTNVHSYQLNAWRNSDRRSHNMVTLAKIRRASKSAQWQEKYSHDGRDKTSKDFADKRRKQLDKWRVTRANTIGGQKGSGTK
jgi:hypothetical protein